MPNFFLGGALAPIGLAVSFLAADPGAVLDQVLSWRASLEQQLEISETKPLPDCTWALDPLESPWTRELIVDCGDWTAYLNNSIGGGDPTAAAPHIAKVLDVRLVVAMHSPPYGPGHAATQLWLLGPDGVPPLMYERTLAAYAEDGRWRWEESGRVQSFEDTSRYSARRIKDRFDRAILVEYLAAIGISVDDEGFYGGGTSVRQLVDYPVRRQSAAALRSEYRLP